MRTHHVAFWIGALMASAGAGSITLGLLTLADADRRLEQFKADQKAEDESYKRTGTSSETAYEFMTMTAKAEQRVRERGTAETVAGSGSLVFGLSMMLWCRRRS